MRYLSQVPKFRCLVFQVKSSSLINSLHPLPPPRASADNPCLPDASDSRLQTLSLSRRAKVFHGLSEKLVSVFTGFPFDRMPPTEPVPYPRRTLTGCLMNFSPAIDSPRECNANMELSHIRYFVAVVTLREAVAQFSQRSGKQLID